MTPTEENLPAIDPVLLDMLVDGELPEAERRELLVQFEQAPGGWRRCALAFLESQCLKDSLADAVPTPTPPARPHARRHRVFHTAGTFLAMAASLLMAFGLGTYFRASWRTLGSHALVKPEVAVQQPAVQVPRLQDDPRALVGNAPRRPISPASPEVGPDSTRLVTVSLPEGVGGGSVRLPVRQVDSFDESWLHGNPQAVSESLRDLLERFGCEVHETRQLVPASTQSGRQVVVPMDQVEVRYVGNPRYQ